MLHICFKTLFWAGFISNIIMHVLKVVKTYFEYLSLYQQKLENNLACISLVYLKNACLRISKAKIVLGHCR